MEGWSSVRQIPPARVKSGSVIFGKNRNLLLFKNLIYLADVCARPIKARMCRTDGLGPAGLCFIL